MVGVLIFSVGCKKREEAQPVQVAAPAAAAASADSFPAGEAGDRKARMNDRATNGGE